MVFDVVERYNKVIIFGAGRTGLTIFNHLIKTGSSKDKVAFCDNSELLQGKYYEYTVYSVSAAVKSYPDALYVISAQGYEEEMKGNLISLGVNPDNIIYGTTKEIIEERDKHFSFSDLRDRTIPLTKIRFEINCAEHCNLNCVGCSTFASLAEPEFVDLEILNNDLKRMSELFSGECESIFLIGGEPLLHPQLGDIVNMARTAFPVGAIFIFTNGVLIPKQSKELWKECRKNDVSVIITKYPLMVDYENFTRVLDNEDIKWSWAFGDDSIKYMESSNIDLTGSQDPEYSFRHCAEANNCIKLKNGKLYTCTPVSAAYKFNKAFNKDLLVTDDDMINIYDDVSAKEILEKLAKPIPFCGYCNKKSETKKFKWSVSKNEISEWIC